ncbi:uncharacterized protein BDV17DRAFT_27218 [Aspergillus undulatus]|uniref:uncharacterized protein n=1 Tax=Aspergillus undulatus TaxID=1810928 RepID=UPI003CCD491B
MHVWRRSADQIEILSKEVDLDIVLALDSSYPRRWHEALNEYYLSKRRASRWSWIKTGVRNSFVALLAESLYILSLLFPGVYHDEIMTLAGFGLRWEGGVAAGFVRCRLSGWNCRSEW